MASEIERPRNCDVYTTVKKAYEKRMGVPMRTRNYFAEWLLAPATEKEGGAK